MNEFIAKISFTAGLSFEDEVDLVLKDIKQLLLSKRKTYGSDNIKKFGELGILVRASDKVERLIHIENTPITNAVIIEQGETINDTWKDLAGYAVLALLERKAYMLPITSTGILNEAEK